MTFVAPQALRYDITILNRETKPSIAEEARQLSAGDPAHWGNWKNLAKAMRRRREKIANVAAEQ